MSVDVDQLIGRTLAKRYRVIRSIGEGGMGVVFEAMHIDLGRRVAIKVLVEDDARALARFGQEALATAKLDSPHIVSVTDFRADPGKHPFIVMEYLEGRTLAQELRAAGLVPLPLVARIAVQLSSALASAHRAGIVHRDVKPANIFLVASPSEPGATDIKLLDFGIAKLFAEGGIKTTAGRSLGTPAYVAPEQVLGNDVDPRTDVHAIGLVLYEMLVGARPWPDKRGPELGLAILREVAPPIVRDDLPPGFAEIVARALAKDPYARFATASAMHEALRSVLDSLLMQSPDASAETIDTLRDPPRPDDPAIVLVTAPMPLAAMPAPAVTAPPAPPVALTRARSTVLVVSLLLIGSGIAIELATGPRDEAQIDRDARSEEPRERRQTITDGSMRSPPVATTEPQPPSTGTPIRPSLAPPSVAPPPSLPPHPRVAPPRVSSEPHAPPSSSRPPPIEKPREFCAPAARDPFTGRCAERSFQF